MAANFWPRQNKYGARKTEYSGVLYDSRREAQVAQELDLLVRAKKVKSWSRQFPIAIVVNGKKICKHVVDFVVVHTDGRKEFWEVKGVETAVFKLKKKLVEATFLVDNPDYKYIIIK